MGVLVCGEVQVVCNGRWSRGVRLWEERWGIRKDKWGDDRQGSESDSDSCRVCSSLAISTREKSSRRQAFKKRRVRNFSILY